MRSRNVAQPKFNKLRDMPQLHGVDGLDAWCQTHRLLATPKKADQDRLDSIICALIGLHWLVADRKDSIMVGDLQHGYMIAPASPGVRTRLENAAAARGIAAI